jgi:hypothetical protein
MATIEPIGKVEEGVIKLYPFDKHYIVLALIGRIEREEKQLKEAQYDIYCKEWISNPLSQAVVDISKRFTNDLKVVLERVEATMEVGK